MPEILEQIARVEPRLAENEIAGTEEDRFTALVRRHSRFVFRVAYSVSRSVQDSDDVVQETFLRIYRSRAWQRIEDEKAFLARVAWRIAVGRKREVPASELDPAIPEKGRSPEQAAIESDLNSALFRLIDALPEELRQPLALAGIEELSSREIASIMGIPEGTVRTRLMRARQVLKEKLRGHGSRK